eukprot:3420670-Lingulodinium_polyedra.AAC.1
MRLWHRQDRAERAAKLPRRHTGPGTARDRPNRALASARRLLRLFRPRRPQCLRVTDSGGRLRTSPAR